MDSECSEIWVIGLIVLCVSLLVSEEKFYDWKNFQINSPLLAEGIKKLQRKYSNSFSDLIKSCLNESPHNRPSLKMIETAIENRRIELDGNSLTLEL